MLDNSKNRFFELSLSFELEDDVWQNMIKLQDWIGVSWKR